MEMALKFIRECQQPQQEQLEKENREFMKEIDEIANDAIINLKKNGIIK